MFSGIIFDFDGVLVDTEWAIFRSWAELYEREGQQLSVQDYAPCLGAGYTRWNPATHLEHLTGKRYDWDAENAARQARIEAELSRQQLMPGAEALLRWCSEHGVRTAVASSSSRRWVGGWLERLGAMHYFAGTFCRTDGYPVKPDPALFCAARQCLALPAEQCLVVEDSENGIRAALAAGIPCVAIPNRLTALCDLSAATMHMSSLHELLDAIRAEYPKKHPFASH